MIHDILDAPEVRDDLRARLLRLEQRTAEVFGQALPEAARAYAVGNEYAANLRGEHGEREAILTARLLQAQLIDTAEVNTTAFWASPLGRALGYWTGGQERTTPAGQATGVPQAEAAALLGVSRQAVNDAVKRGRLQLAIGPGFGLTALSVADLMHARYPLRAAAA